MFVSVRTIDYDSRRMAATYGNFDLTRGSLVATAGSGAAKQSPPITDSELLQGIANGDSAALEEFYDRHAGTVFAVAYRLLNDGKEAEDLVQEVLLQLWERATAFDPAQGRPLAWVITLARNKAIDRLRSAHRRARLLEEVGTDIFGDESGASPSAADAVGAGEQAALVRAALVRLPAEQRRAIEMAFFGGLTQSEIAAELNEALGTVKARIRRGMLRLREELAPQLC